MSQILKDGQETVISREEKGGIHSVSEMRACNSLQEAEDWSSLTVCFQARSAPVGAHEVFGVGSHGNYPKTYLGLTLPTTKLCKFGLLCSFFFFSPLSASLGILFF